MIEQDGFEISSFIVATPGNCSSDLSYEDNEEAMACIFNELGALGVTEIGHYSEFFVKVDRDYSMTMEKQYYLVVEGLKRILKLKLTN